MCVCVPVTSCVFGSTWTEAPEASSSCATPVGVTVEDDGDRDSSKLLKFDTAGTDTTEKQTQLELAR